MYIKNKQKKFIICFKNNLFISYNLVLLIVLINFLAYDYLTKLQLKINFYLLL